MSSAPPKQRSALLALPYDVRHLIYQHLFPPGIALYLQAWPHAFRHLPAASTDTVPTALFRTCRGLHAEAAAYLYNAYLFNVIGSKRDCLAAHDRFVRTLQRHARDGVHVHAFGNGSVSGTMCISMHAGAGMVEVVRRRERGEARRIEDVRAEVRADGTVRRIMHGDLDEGRWVLPVALALIGCILAWTFSAMASVVSRYADAVE